MATRMMIATDSHLPATASVAIFSHGLVVGLAGRGHDVAVVVPSARGCPVLKRPGRWLAIFWVRSLLTLYDA